MITLTNVGAAYDAIAASRGLGFVEADLSGVTQIAVQVRYNHVGTGTITWQVWNDTDGIEIGVLSHSLAGDNKLLTGSFSVSVLGIKTLRLRCKSTVSTDDPVFYGASFRLIRG